MKTMSSKKFYIVGYEKNIDPYTQIAFKSINTMYPAFKKFKKEYTSNITSFNKIPIAFFDNEKDAKKLLFKLKMLNNKSKIKDFYLIEVDNYEEVEPENDKHYLVELNKKYHNLILNYDENFIENKYSFYNISDIDSILFTITFNPKISDLNIDFCFSQTNIALFFASNQIEFNKINLNKILKLKDSGYDDSTLKRLVNTHYGM